MYLALFIVLASQANTQIPAFVSKFLNEPHPDLQKAIETSSALFLGTPYKLDPLGEGESSTIDRDPKYRFDQFDCTTFVETVAALSLAQSESEFSKVMDAIRYSGPEHTYFTRNHFIETEWLPNAISKQLIREVTAEVFSPELLETLKFKIDRSLLFRKHRTKLPVEMWKEPKKSELTFIPISKLIANKSLFNQIPSGTFFNLIKLKSKKNGVVVHQGILIRKTNQLFIRHATTLSRNQVIDMDAIHFFRMHLKNQRSERVQKLGIQLFNLGNTKRLRANSE